MGDRLQLHRARLQKGIDLARITATTALHPSVVAKIDQGRFEELPAGIYARAYVRAFASAVGVNAHHAVADLEPLLPAVVDPVPAMRELSPPSSLDTLKSFFATQQWPVKDVRLPWRRVGASALDALLLVSIGVVLMFVVAWTCGVPVHVLLEQAGLELAVMYSVPVLLYFLLLERVAGRTVGAMACGTGEEVTARVVLRLPRRVTAVASTSASVA